MHRRPARAAAGRWRRSPDCPDRHRVRPAVVEGAAATPGITAAQGNGLEGSGIIVFLVGIATLALVALPYATGDRPLGLDRWLSFAILAVVGWIGFGIRIVVLPRQRRLPVRRAGPGLHQRPGAVARRRSAWSILSRATYDMAREPAYR